MLDYNKLTIFFCLRNFIIALSAVKVLNTYFEKFTKIT